MLVIPVLEVSRVQRSVPFQCEVPGIEPGPAMLGDSARLYLPLDSRIVLSQSEMQRAASAGSHGIVDAVVANACVSAALIRGEMYPAEEDVAGVDVKAADNAGKGKERGVIIR